MSFGLHDPPVTLLVRYRSCPCKRPLVEQTKMTKTERRLLGIAGGICRPCPRVSESAQGFSRRRAIVGKTHPHVVGPCLTVLERPSRWRLLAHRHRSRSLRLEPSKEASPARLSCWCRCLCRHWLLDLILLWLTWHGLFDGRHGWIPRIALDESRLALAPFKPSFRLVDSSTMHPESQYQMLLACFRMSHVLLLNRRCTTGRCQPRGVVAKGVGFQKVSTNAFMRGDHADGTILEYSGTVG